MLLDVKGRVTPDCSKTHITYSFDVRRTGKRLNIRFTYTPKLLEDREKSRKLIEEGMNKYVLPEHRKPYNWEDFFPLQNLITVSVDDPLRHRGASHSHSGEQRHYIGADGASPGLAAGPVHTGIWCVTLSLHSIVTDACDYTLQVWEGEADA